MASPANSALLGCVSSLQSSMSLLNSSIAILDTGVSDFPRLAKVLQTTRHFELLPESTLASAQSTLLSSLGPELHSLLSRVETHLDRLARREQSLIAKAELQEGRLSSFVENKATSRPQSRGAGEDLQGVEIGEREIIRMKTLKQKKERLNLTVGRLTLQAQHKERQLRMSVAGSRE